MSIADATPSTRTKKTKLREESSPKALLRSTMDHPLFDYRLLIVVAAVLLCLGLLMVISSSSVIAAATYQDPYYFGKRQLIFAGIGLLGAFFLSRCSEKLVRYVAWPALFLAALLIVLTIFTPLGIDVAGNRNWMSFGPSWTQFQPSEFAKLAIIIWGANDLANKRRVLVDMRQWLTYLCATLLLVGLVLIQKDAGTAMVMAAIIIIVMVAVGAPWRLLAGFGISAVGAMAIMVLLEPYRMQRILAFLRPDSDPLGYNLQARRGIYALASGGWFGQGLGSSRQKWGLLTEAHTDYIFAIIGEELGLLGTLTVILLFLILTAVGLRIALKSKSLFSKYVAIGVVAWFAAQAFANIAVAIRLIPVLGIPLPMISYGGSSLMANLFALGLLAGCARREPHAAQVFLTRKAKPKVTTIVRAQA